MKIYYYFRQPLLILLSMIVLSACGEKGANPAATINVQATPATAFAQTVATAINTPITITVQGAGISMFQVVNQPANGILTGEFSGAQLIIVYSPNLDYVGTDIISLNVTAANGSKSVGTINVQVLGTVLPTTDSDGDGLLDLEEINTTFTNPTLADTDGDGFSDFDEVITFAFNKSVNNFRFNPLIADMPEIDIQLVSQPEIQLNYTTTNGTSTTLSTNRSISSSTAVSHSKAGSSTWSTSVSHQAGVSLSISKEADISPTGGVKVTVTGTASYTNTNTEGHETSTSWDDTSTSENGRTKDSGEAFEQNNSISTSDGDILVSAKVVNTGNVAYKLNNLFLNASYFDGTRNQPFVPVGTLKFDDPNNSQFPAFTLSPGQATGTMTFRTSPLNVNTVKKLLVDSRGLNIRPSIFDMLDQNGASYNFASTGISTQTALVKVDYIGNGGRKNITKRVAVHGDAVNTVTADQILNTILNVNTVVTNIAGIPAAQGFIESVDGLANNEPTGFWLMVHGTNQGNNKIVTTAYTTPTDRAAWIARGSLDPATPSIVDNYNLSQITINAGDILHLMYIQDSDLDGLPDVQEFFYRSDPMVKDTDFDGLEDSVEVKGWDVIWEGSNLIKPMRRVFSSPTLADTDGDGLTDDMEANFVSVPISTIPATHATNSLLRRNPRLSDTDGDSIVDAVDDLVVITGALGPNTFQNLNVSNLSTTVIPVVGLNDNVSVTLTLPTSLASMPANGYSSYTVATYRLVEASANFSSPASPPVTGIVPLLNDTLPCSPGLGCPWVAVDVFHTTGMVAPILSHTFIDTGALPVNSSVKYIAYVSVDNIWRKDPVSMLASSNSEIIRFTMHAGMMSNVKTIMGPFHHAGTTGAFAGRHDSFNPNWYYFPTTLVVGGATTYSRFDTGRAATPDLVRRGSDVMVGTDRFSKDINGVLIDSLAADYWQPALAYPFFNGDGQVDLRWWLKVDGITLYDSGVQAIDNTKRDNLTADINNPVPNAIPASLGTPVYSGATSSFVNTTDPLYAYPAAGVFEIELPAIAQCYMVDLGETETDSKLGGINPIGNGDANAVVDLCRDNSPVGSGIWTLTSRATGAVLGSTRKGNLFPVTFNGYVYWRDKPPADQTVPWTNRTDWHAVTKAFDLQMGYDMSVR